MTVLASGSRGNAALFEAGETRVLVDAGIPVDTLRRRMAATGCALPPTAVVITHAHGDHHGFVNEVAGHFALPVYVTESVQRSVAVTRTTSLRVFSPREPFQLGDFVVRPCALPHDAPQVALRFERGPDSAVIATDLGEVPDGLERLLRGAKIALLESNHDLPMLWAGPYSRGLKRRVASPRGHLSNEQTHALLRGLDRDVETVVLMHLSETNNRPELAREVAADALSDHPARLLLASQSSPVQIEAEAPRQLSLFG